MIHYEVTLGAVYILIISFIGGFGCGWASYSCLLSKKTEAEKEE